jgi:carbon-monoxide dehydrogenase medium subunit
MLSRRTLPSFELAEPESVADVVALIAAGDESVKILAGGVDLVSRMRNGTATPRLLVSLHRVDELHGIRKDGESLRIGAMATLREVEADAAVQSDYCGLQQAIASIISTQVKNVATTVGNICVGTPASDVATALVALAASCHVVSRLGARTVAIEDFFVNTRKTVLGPGEMVTEISVPSTPAGSTSVFAKMARTATDISKVCVAVALTIQDETCSHARIGLGAVASTPVRARRAEYRLMGSQLSPAVIREASLLAAESASPIDDIRSTAAYRERMVPILVSRALSAILANRGGISE